MTSNSPSPLKAEGVLASGLGRGAEFLAIGWVRTQIRELTGADPYPGTLNLRIRADDWEGLFARRHGFHRIADPASDSCPGYLRRVLLRSPRGAVASAYIVLPELTVYRDVLEVVSGERLRDKLGLDDGDIVAIEEFEK